MLPFHQMGKDKWAATGEPDLLAETRTPTTGEVAEVRAQFEAHGLATY